MNSTKWLARAVAALLAAAAGAGVSADSADRRRPAFAATDAATGAAIRVYRGEGAISIEIDHPTVQVRKQLANGETTTRMRAGDEELVVTLSRDAIKVSGPAGRVEGGPARPERARDALAMLAASPAATKAAALIGRMQLPAASPLRQTLLSTRALLLSSGGDDRGATDLSRAIAELERTRRGTGLIRTSAAQDLVGPSVCWSLYVVEAIAAYTEYEDCMANEQWWDIFGQAACALIYDIRAIGAFAWWLSCVGLNG
jgi:hypothetical protein